MNQVRPHQERMPGSPRAGVSLVDYDPRWPQQYNEEAMLLVDRLGSQLRTIGHVGSTSIPGMPSKPILDVLAGVATYDGFDSVVQRLGGIGYLYTPEAESDDADRRVFRKGLQDTTRPRTHHLHLTEVGSFYWQRIIAFRDHLRQHPADAAAYVKLKRELAAAHESDARSYTAGKHRFVRAIERKAGLTQDVLATRARVPAV